MRHSKQHVNGRQEGENDIGTASRNRTKKGMKRAHYNWDDQLWIYSPQFRDEMVQGLLHWRLLDTSVEVRQKWLTSCRTYLLTKSLGCYKYLVWDDVHTISPQTRVRENTRMICSGAYNLEHDKKQGSTPGTLAPSSRKQYICSE